MWDKYGHWLLLVSGVFLIIFIANEIKEMMQVDEEYFNQKNDMPTGGILDEFEFDREEDRGSNKGA